MNDVESQIEPIYTRPSKGELKRDMTRMQRIGEQIVNLTPGQLSKIQISESLLAAVMEARRLKAHGAKRRQIQYIGRIIEHCDVDSISKQLSVVNHPVPKTTAAVSAKSENIEFLKRLLTSSDQVIFELLSAKLDLNEITEVRTSIRKAKKSIVSGIKDIETVAINLKEDLNRFGMF
jgi:ribosome-associated protein